MCFNKNQSAQSALSADANQESRVPIRLGPSEGTNRSVSTTAQAADGPNEKGRVDHGRDARDTISVDVGFGRGIGSGAHLSRLDFAGGELVELDVLEVPEDLARGLELVRAARGLEPAPVQDDEMLAGSDGRLPVG